MVVDALVHKLPDICRVHARLDANMQVEAVGKDAVEVVQQHVAQHVGLAAPSSRFLDGNEAMSGSVVDKHVAVWIRLYLLLLVVVDAVAVLTVACPPVLQLAVVDAPYIDVAMFGHHVVGQSGELPLLVRLAQIVNRVFVEQAGKACLCYLEILRSVYAILHTQNGRLRVLVKVVFVYCIQGIFFFHRLIQFLICLFKVHQLSVAIRQTKDWNSTEYKFKQIILNAGRNERENVGRGANYYVWLK